MAWKVVAEAPDQLTAELWVGILKDAGIPAMVHPSDAVSFTGVSGKLCRVQVPEEALEAAREVIGDGDDAD